MKTAIFQHLHPGEYRLVVNCEEVIYAEQAGDGCTLYLSSGAEVPVRESPEQVATLLSYGLGGVAIIRAANTLIDEVEIYIEEHPEAAALRPMVEELAEVIRYPG